MAKLLYYFPLDNIVNNDIVNNYKNQVQSGLQNNALNVDFDEYKGSYLNFKDKTQLELTFKKSIGKEGTLINFFFNYHKKNSSEALNLITIGDKILSVIKSNNRNAVSFKSNVRINDEDFRIRENHWFNASVYYNSSGNIELYLTDDNFLVLKKAVISFNDAAEDQNIIVGGNKDGDQLRIADLSVYNDVSKDEIENLVNTSIGKHLTLLSKSTLIDTVSFALSNNSAFDKLVIENDPKPLSFELLPGEMTIERQDNSAAKLKVKKGFFQYSAVQTNKTEESDDLHISFSFKNQNTENTNLTAVLNDLSIVNRLDQERILVQLEMYNITLTKDEFSKTYTKSQPLIIDKVFEIMDIRGENESPFEVFILGNDTLYNGTASEAQTIRLAISNTTELDLQLSESSGFRITGNFFTILENDAKQTNNTKLLEHQSFTTIPAKPKSTDNDFLCFQKEYLLKKGTSIIMEISGLKAKQSAPANPSGAYPFYLEYKNIPGYRNGKMKFHIKTGKIFYSL
ncbi:hypothetical protein [Chryseobacterium sp. SL1]|uniref:hypothetical protein n=1 Tax=Chryseobacterium sp. SL1 TaxID=2995159 RepID=UPI0022746ACA|nr:hypothetical protein [Chryseobacterium sp. SL1]MCY1662379.1 hypothetical protein [Chryseobacterium sp. SL1]